MMYYVRKGEDPITTLPNIRVSNIRFCPYEHGQKIPKEQGATPSGASRTYLHPYVRFTL